MTPEQKARDLLERMGFQEAQNMSAGDVGELAQLISDMDTARRDAEILRGKLEAGIALLEKLEKLLFERMVDDDDNS